MAGRHGLRNGSRGERIGGSSLDRPGNGLGIRRRVLSGIVRRWRRCECLDRRDPGIGFDAGRSCAQFREQVPQRLDFQPGFGRVFASGKPVQHASNAFDHPFQDIELRCRQMRCRRLRVVELAQDIVQGFGEITDRRQANRAGNSRQGMTDAQACRSNRAFGFVAPFADILGERAHAFVGFVEKDGIERVTEHERPDAPDVVLIGRSGRIGFRGRFTGEVTKPVRFTDEVGSFNHGARVGAKQAHPLAQARGAALCQVKQGWRGRAFLGQPQVEALFE